MMRRGTIIAVAALVLATAPVGAAAWAEELASGKPKVPEKPAAGQPATGQPAAGQPATGQPAVGQPAVGQPAAGQPAAGQPATGQPATGQPAVGQPAVGQPAAEMPAVEKAVPKVNGEKSGLLSIGIGWYDWNDDKDAVDFRLEYRSPHEVLWHVKPWIGMEGTTDGAVYGVAGILVDLFLGSNLVFTPSFGGGLYADGGGKDLGHVVEFRSQLELGYRFDDRSRLSVAVSHISNASLDDNNPGTEVATIYYHMPIRSLFGE